MSHILALAERSVPRYTSYPTAPHFTRAVGPEAYANWLAAVPPAAAVSIYLHVPYCAHLCLYCGCHTKAVRRRDPVVVYATRLIQEIDAVAAATGGRRIVHLHWGGGTPSILGEAALAEITARLARQFDLSALAEHAIELDPRRMSRALAFALAANGVNRVSLGVQEFAPHVQQTIGRIQPFDCVRRAVGWLHEAGIERINLDLMYGLPRQTAADVAATAELAAELAPQRLALFGYAHVPWLKPHQRLIEETQLPDAAQRLAQARIAAETLLAHGYVAIGLDHFARPDDALAQAQRSGRLRRNFQGYTTDAADALIGLGASAISRLRQGYVQNTVDVAGHAREVAAGRLATAKGIAFTPDDRLRGLIIERLMCDLAVDLDAVAQAARVPRGENFADEIDALSALAAEGVVEIDYPRIAVTEQGRPFVRLVAAAFDAYLPHNRTRHSIAV